MSDNKRIEQAERDLRDAEDMAALALKRIESATARLDAARREPTEPKIGSVIKFQVQFGGVGTVYTYVATRVATGFWYVTNTSGAYDWDGIVKIMLKDDTAKTDGIRFFLYSTGKGAGKWMGRQD